MFGNNMYPPYMGMGPNMMGRGIAGMAGSGLRMNGLSKGLGGGLFSKIKGGFNISSILTNTQKTLNIVNQAIPVVKQAGPMFNNMKTMVKLAGAFKDTTNNKNNKKENNVVKQENKKEEIKKEKINDLKLESYDNNPSFFI